MEYFTKVKLCRFQTLRLKGSLQKWIWSNIPFSSFMAVESNCKCKWEKHPKSNIEKRKKKENESPECNTQNLNGVHLKMLLYAPKSLYMPV